MIKDTARRISRRIYFSSPASAQKLMLNLIPKQRLFRKHLRELEKNQWFSAEQLEELQSEKLKQIIHHAYANVPYYRKTFDERGLKPDDIKCPKDLGRLPILTKDDIRQHFKELQASNIEQYKPYLSYSGGSTGKPLEFYNDKIFHWAENLMFARSRHWFLLYPEHPKRVIMRYQTDFAPVDEGVAPHYQVDNALYLSAFHLKSSNLDDYINRIRGFKPQLIWSFASTLYVLAQHIREKELSPILTLRAIRTSAETLLPHFRKVIEEAFGVKIYDHYGCNEGVVRASECPNGSRHIDVEYGILDIVDPDGMAVPIGKPGIVIGTSLNKYAMPLIRYRLGDIAILSDKSCSCGRGLPVLASVEGRLDDLIVTKDGCLVGRLDEAFHSSFGIKMSQIIQEEVGSIVVRIVKRPSYSNDDVKILDTELKKRLGEDMSIEYRFVDDIERVGRGKYRFVLSKIDIARLYQ
ncbi:phenylacetate--CoA ligase family protein [Chloroflexota bacterium]